MAEGFRRLSDIIRDWDNSKPLGKEADVDLDSIFVEEPVPLDVFIKDKFYMNNPPLSEVQFEAVRHIERIFYPQTYYRMAVEFDSDYWAQPYRMINFATLEWGKGSGKDHICRICSLRIAYLLMCLRNPQQYFGMPEQDTIHLLNIASSAPQAYEAFFAPITRVVRKGWFADKCSPTINKISYAKSIEVISGNSDAETQEGLNLMLGVADEIDAFKTKSELEKSRGKQEREPTRSAEGILKMLRTSAATRFPETFKIVRISYPRYKGSTIQKLRQQGQFDNEKRGEKSRHYTSGPLKTWDVNPRYKDYELISIPQTDELVPDVASFVEDYEEDPVMAKAMYECNPARAVDTYYKNMDAFRACVNEESQPITVSYEPVRFHSDVTGKSTIVWQPVYNFHENFRPIQGARYCLHADMSIKNDKAGFAMSHVVKWVESVDKTIGKDGEEHEAIEKRAYAKNDFAFAWEADNSAVPAREIQIRWARLLVFELIKRGFNVVWVSYDGFQSADSLQILESHGIECDRVSMDLKDDPWKNLRDLAYEARLEMPYNFDLLDELEALGRQPNGKIDHPPGGSKDIADALAGSLMAAIQQGGEEDADKEQSYFGENTPEVGSLGVDLIPVSDISYESDMLPIGFELSFGSLNPMLSPESR